MQTNDWNMESLRLRMVNHFSGDWHIGTDSFYCLSCSKKAVDSELIERNRIAAHRQLMQFDEQQCTAPADDIQKAGKWFEQYKLHFIRIMRAVSRSSTSSRNAFEYLRDKYPKWSYAIADNWRGTNWNPPGEVMDWYKNVTGESFIQAPVRLAKCECGVASVGGFHSSWCPIK